jgi:hypothetical protein
MNKINKACTKCLQIKLIDEFYSNRPDCKFCVKQRSNLYRLNNKEKCLNSVHEWCLLNTHRKSIIDKAWREQNKQRVYSNKKAWRELNRNKENNLNKIKYNTNIQYKTSVLLRSRLNQAIKGLIKSGSAIRDLGCSISELKAHLEVQFEPDMTWGNWSRKGWHIDHIKPLAAFDLSNPKELKEACHYKNLQPLWAKDNLVKSTHFAPQQSSDQLKQTPQELKPQIPAVAPKSQPVPYPD